MASGSGRHEPRTKNRKKYEARSKRAPNLTETRAGQLPPDNLPFPRRLYKPRPRPMFCTCHPVPIAENPSGTAPVQKADATQRWVTCVLGIAATCVQPVREKSELSHGLRLATALSHEVRRSLQYKVLKKWPGAQEATPDSPVVPCPPRGRARTPLWGIMSCALFKETQ